MAREASLSSHTAAREAVFASKIPRSAAASSSRIPVISKTNAIQGKRRVILGERMDVENLVTTPVNNNMKKSFTKPKGTRRPNVHISTSSPSTATSPPQTIRQNRSMDRRLASRPSMGDTMTMKLSFDDQETMLFDMRPPEMSHIEQMEEDLPSPYLSRKQRPKPTPPHGEAERVPMVNQDTDTPIASSSRSTNQPSMSHRFLNLHSSNPYQAPHFPTPVYFADTATLGNPQRRKSREDEMIDATQATLESPNQRPHKSATFHDSAARARPRQSLRKDRLEVVITPRPVIRRQSMTPQAMEKGKAKASPLLTPAAASLSKRESPNLDQSMTTNGSKKKPRQSVSRRSLPKSTVKSAKRRLSTPARSDRGRKSMTPSAILALSGRKLGLMEEALRSSPGDDPLLLRGLDEDNYRRKPKSSKLARIHRELDDESLREEDTTFSQAKSAQRSPHPLQSSLRQVFNPPSSSRSSSVVKETEAAAGRDSNVDLQPEEQSADIDTRPPLDETPMDFGEDFAPEPFEAPRGWASDSGDQADPPDNTNVTFTDNEVNGDMGISSTPKDRSSQLKAEQWKEVVLSPDSPYHAAGTPSMRLRHAGVTPRKSTGLVIPDSSPSVHDSLQEDEDLPRIDDSEEAEIPRADSDAISLEKEVEALEPSVGLETSIVDESEAGREASAMPSDSAASEHDEGKEVDGDADHLQANDSELLESGEEQIEERASMDTTTEEDDGPMENEETGRTEVGHLTGTSAATEERMDRELAQEREDQIDADDVEDDSLEAEERPAEIIDVDPVTSGDDHLEQETNAKYGQDSLESAEAVELSIMEPDSQELSQSYNEAASLPLTLAAPETTSPDLSNSMESNEDVEDIESSCETSLEPEKPDFPEASMKLEQELSKVVPVEDSIQVFQIQSPERVPRHSSSSLSGAPSPFLKKQSQIDDNEAADQEGEDESTDELTVGSADVTQEGNSMDWEMSDDERVSISKEDKNNIETDQDPEISNESESSVQGESDPMVMQETGWPNAGRDVRTLPVAKAEEPIAMLDGSAEDASKVHVSPAITTQSLAQSDFTISEDDAPLELDNDVHSEDLAVHPEGPFVQAREEPVEDPTSAVTENVDVSDNQLDASAMKFSNEALESDIQHQSRNLMEEDEVLPHRSDLSSQLPVEDDDTLSETSTTAEEDLLHEDGKLSKFMQDSDSVGEAENDRDVPEVVMSAEMEMDMINSSSEESEEGCKHVTQKTQQASSSRKILGELDQTDNVESATTVTAEAETPSAESPKSAQSSRIILRVINRGIIKVEPEQSEDIRGAADATAPNTTLEDSNTDPTRPSSDSADAMSGGPPLNTSDTLTSSPPSDVTKTSQPSTSAAAPAQSVQHPQINTAPSPAPPTEAQFSLHPSSFPSPTNTLSSTPKTIIPPVFRFPQANSPKGNSPIESMLGRRFRPPSSLSKEVIVSQPVSPEETPAPPPPPATSSFNQAAPSNPSNHRQGRSTLASPSAGSSRSLHDELVAATSADDLTWDNSFDSVVEVSSHDPRAAARAAAILKMNHAYIEHGILPSAPSASTTPLPATPSTLQTPQYQHYPVAGSSRSPYLAGHDSTRHLDKDELLHEAELEIVTSHHRRSRSRSRARSEIRLEDDMDSERSFLDLPGGWRPTPVKRKRAPSLVEPLQKSSETTKPPAQDATDRPWGIAEWKKLEKVYRVEREAWRKERATKNLPSPGWLSWASKLGGSTEGNAKQWTPERVVRSFVDCEKAKGLGVEWAEEVILLRVQALEKRVTRKSRGQTELGDDAHTIKRQRLNQPATPARHFDGVDPHNIEPPSTIRRMVTSLWSVASSFASESFSHDWRMEKDLPVFNDTSASSALQLALTEDQVRHPETQQPTLLEPVIPMQQVPGPGISHSTPLKSICAFSPAHPSSPAWSPALPLPGAMPRSSRVSTSTTTKPLYPPLYPPLDKRTEPIKNLFASPASASTVSSRSTPIAIPRRLSGRPSPTVKELVRSFEDEGVLSRSFEKEKEGAGKGDPGKRVQSRDL